MLAASTEWEMSFYFIFFLVGGGGACFWSPLLLYLRSICSFPLSFSFSYFLFLPDGLRLDENSQRGVKSKTTFTEIYWEK